MPIISFSILANDLHQQRRRRLRGRNVQRRLGAGELPELEIEAADHSQTVRHLLVVRAPVDRDHAQQTLILLLGLRVAPLRGIELHRRVSKK